MTTTKTKCPQCRSNNLVLTEIWDGATITWEQKDGKIDRSDGNLNPGDPVKLQGNCLKCDHIWTIRNVKQIDEILTS